MKVVRESLRTIEASIFANLESWASSRSKDPTTKVGAAVYHKVTGNMYLGYNGFPRGIADYEERWGRPAKYSYAIHAEINAILKALPAIGSQVRDCVLYTTHEPCSKCMLVIIQCGIREVRYLYEKPDTLSTELATEAGVSVTQFKP